MTFDYPGYDLKFIQKRRCKDASEHLFTLIFKFHSPITKYSYILSADYHKEDVFGVKFYAQKDKRSDFKYNKIINKGDLGNILVTCAKIIPILLQNYPTASFGFIGSRTVDESSKKAEAYSNNQRFKIYRYIVSTKFGNQTFEHFEYEMISGYLLVNKSNKEIEEKERAIVEMFTRTYNTLPDLTI